MRAVPFNALSALGNPPNPWHDSVSNTFVIDENGIIDEVISDVKTKAHAAQILK